MSKKKTIYLPGILLMIVILIAVIGIFPQLVIFAVIIAAGYIFFRRKQYQNIKKKILASGIREIDLMQGAEFEKYLSILFNSMGFKVTSTPEKGNFGADIILNKDSRIIAVRAKRYNKTVGVDIVQKSYAAKSYYNAHEVWIVTNQNYSAAAQEFAQKSGMKLINRQQLINIIIKQQETVPPVQ